MNKELTPSEAWKLIYKSIEDALQDYETLQDDFNKLYERTYKEHKALEIIKAHPEQLLDIINTDNYNEYLDLDYAPNQYISEKQYDLLKKALS